MLRGRTIRIYPPSPCKRREGRGGWPLQRTGWRGGATGRIPFTFIPLSNRRRPSFRQLVEASRALVDDLTPLRVLESREASGVLNELTNRPGTFWDGATGSGMNWRLAVSELEAERRHLRLDGEPVILYSLLSPPGAAKANLLQGLYRLDATMTVTLEWRPQRLDAARRKIRGAQRHYFSKRYSMAAHVQETEGSAAAMVDSAAAAESDRLGDALIELETDGIAYGDPGADRGGPRAAIRDRAPGRRYPAHLCQPRCQGDPGRLRAASRLVLAHARSTPAAAGPFCFRLGRVGGHDGPDLRAAGGNTVQRPLEESGLGRARNPMENPLLLRSVQRRRGTYAGAWRDRRG